MPVLFEYTPKINFLYYTGFGLCSTDDFFHAIQQTIQNEIIGDHLRVVFDVRFADEIEFGPKDFKRAVEILSTMKKHKLVFKNTAVISKSKVAGGFIKALSLILSEHPIKIRLYNSPQEASEWIGLANEENEISRVERMLHDKFIVKQES